MADPWIGLHELAEGKIINKIGIPTQCPVLVLNIMRDENVVMLEIKMT